jgi:hypothetical protein
MKKRHLVFNIFLSCDTSTAGREPVLRIWISMFLVLPDPDPLVPGTDPDPDPSMNKQKIVRETLIPTVS